MRFFDEIVIGDREAIDRYKKQIEGLAAKDLLQMNTDKK